VSGAPLPDVDLVVNTFERTWRRVLTPGFFPGIEAANRRHFRRRVALLNNVADAAGAEAAALALVKCGEVDEFHRVGDLLPQALEWTGLSPRDLGSVPHYSDCALVAVTLPGSEWLLYWDAEVTLREPADWVGPALALMAADPRVAVANPAWARRGPAEGVLEEKLGFALGYGFSDQVFLARRSELGRPVYREGPCPASLRYPLAHVAAVFEQRVDAYMRVRRRLRATCCGVVYVHPADEGASYPPASTGEALRSVAHRVITRLLRLSPLADPRFRI
jgi:hypothetical protein